MARNDWRGDAAAVAQVDRLTVGGTVTAADWVQVERNRKAVRYTADGTETLAEIAAALAALYEAATFSEFKEAPSTYTDGDDFFDLTASEPGRPHTFVASDSGGTLTLTLSNETSSTGPSHVDEPKNWTLGTLPDNTNDVVVERGAPMLWGLGTIAALSWEFRSTYDEPVGLPAWNSEGQYVEDRTRFLTINSANVKVNSASPRMYVKAVASSSWDITGTGQREDDGVPALDLSATGNPTMVAVAAGDVGLCVTDESAARTFAAASLAGDDSRLTVGRRVTVTALDQDKGTVDAFGTVTTATMGTGEYTQHEGTLTTLVTYGGTANLNHEGTTTVTAEGNGTEPGPVVNCEANNRARTFANSTFKGGAYLLDNNKSVTLDPGGTHAADMTFFANSRLGPSVTWNRV